MQPGSGLLCSAHPLPMVCTWDPCLACFDSKPTCLLRTLLMVGLQVARGAAANSWGVHRRSC